MVKAREIGAQLGISHRTVETHLLKALRSVMIHDKALTSWLNGLYDSQEKAGDEIIPPEVQ